MNNLSWLIYFGGVSESLSAFFGILASFAGIMGVIALLYGAANKDQEHINSDKWKFGNNVQKRSLVITPILVGILGLVSVLLPSQQTVYAIAASEMGEKVISNPRVMQSTNKAFDALDHWLDAQITNPKVEEKK